MSGDSDRQFLNLVNQSVVPIGHRPEKPQEIETMLRACADAPMADDKLERMLKKIKGLLPIGERSQADAADFDAFEKTLTDGQRELVALHKAQGGEMPPEIRVLLEKFREQARLQGKQSPPAGDTDVERS